ncbi:P-loop containing nucleoside triphosphate hydrolase protein [Scheffersomyces amazonensis]|uniref:P-loop containing nucleoside triphosphate hydrolase protein n=1 Tax=Scheffersomyces amazonensis TaxID=1078765 RepID=UPI00315C7E0B
MFLRKKPPQLSLLEELQQTYNDCCETSIKNLYLEEDRNDIESALKGWKSLHTSLLYKLELFDKKKVTAPEEWELLQDLKNIRDQNVKHLIRVQLRMDEINRKKKIDPSREAAILSVANSANTRTSIPSLRTTQSNQSSNSRSMLKSLRPQNSSSLSSASINTSSNSSINGHNTVTNSNNNSINSYHHASSKVAANLTYQPKRPQIQVQHPSSYQSSTYTNTNINSKPLSRSEDDLFEDFDEEEGFDFVSNDYHGNTTSNWEKLNGSRSSSGISEISSNEKNSNNLIDLDDDDIYSHSNNHNYNHNNHNHNHNHNGNGGYSRDFDKSFEDLLTIKKVAPPVPPKRHGRTSHSISGPPSSEKQKSNSFDQTSNNSNDNLVTSMGSSHAKSTGDITIKPVSESPPKEIKVQEVPKKKPYVYTKPKPINVNQIMKKTSQSRLKQQQLQQQASQQQQQQQQHAKPKSNITYQYVKKQVPAAKKISPPPQSHSAPPQAKKEVIPPTSPTMDDLLSGYEEGEGEEDYGNEDVPSYLKNEVEQEKLIASIRGIDANLAKQILNDIVIQGDEVYWDDIVGLEAAKNSLKEAVVYPFLRPDLFQGLREPVRGMLLFGPPGTGKTMLARAVATESKSTFFQMNSSSLTSKYLGESEKLVKALFLLAKKLSPSIIFMDEIDSLLGSRTEGELESIRRIKNEFLISWSELSSATANSNSKEDNRVLILGATNLPWSIDEAARRRFVRRQYIPLPEGETRISQIKRLLKYQNNTLSDEDYNDLIKLTEGFSGSDITALAKDSAMGPLRELGEKLLLTPTEQIRPINRKDFENSLKYIRPSVSKEGLKEYEDWSEKFGSSGI